MDREKRIFLRHLLGRDIWWEVPLTEAQQAALDDMMQERRRGVPVAKIVGYKEFWKDTFRTTVDTLDPRPDSETLIEAVLDYVPKAKRICDLGTGTGCLLLSLLREYPEATGVGVDVSEAALAVAVHNRDALGLTDRAAFLKSDWFSEVKGTFDVIVSNPPYIQPGDPRVNAEAHFDPSLALYGGQETYDAILSTLLPHAEAGTLVFLEIGDPIELPAAYELLEIRNDLAGRPRVMVVRIRS